MSKLQQAFTNILDLKTKKQYLKSFDKEYGKLYSEFSERLSAGEIIFDFNGHHRKRKTKPIVPKNYEYAFRHEFPHEEKLAHELYTALLIRVTTLKQVRILRRLLKKPETGWVELTGLNQLGYCYECGKRLKYKFNGNTIKVIGRCKHPKGCPPITFNINVPSGIMYFSNFFDKIEPFDQNTTYRRGEHGYLEHLAELNHYANQNIAQVYCGNSCPGIYKDKDKFWIGNPGYENDSIVDPMPGKQIGSICTDLWAWSMTCANTYKNLGCKRHVDFEVKVNPGTYQVTQLFFSKGGYGPGDKSDIFATMTRLK